MAKVLINEPIAPDVFRMVVVAPDVARYRKAGQFVIVRPGAGKERIPLTIADADATTGAVTLIYQVVGRTTAVMSLIEPGGQLTDIAGPLGQPTHIAKVGTVVMVGGGIGVAPSHPIAQAMKAAGNKVITIMGARRKDLFIMEAEMRAASDEVILMSDDGSYGEKGFVTDALRRLLDGGEKVDLVVAIGPPIMMKMVSLLTKGYGVHTLVSLNTIMVDGTGMCGGCRVTVGGESRFVCVDGPEFDGHLVDFDEMMRRQRMYVAYEKEAYEAFKSGHKCRLEAVAKEAHHG
jgi:ferredoxin--NADP+ reductase